MPPKKKKIVKTFTLQHGVNIMEFVKAYNAATDSMRGDVVPAQITVYEDRTFTFVLKTPPAAQLLIKAAGIPKGSGVPHKERSARSAARSCARSPRRRCPT